MDGSSFYRNDRLSSDNRSRIRNTPPSGSSSESNSETPLSRQRHETALASNLSACQAQLTNVLTKLEETTKTMENMSERLKGVENKLSQQVEDDASPPKTKGKRRRPKDSLTIQVCRVKVDAAMTCQLTCLLCIAIVCNSKLNS